MVLVSRPLTLGRIAGQVNAELFRFGGASDREAVIPEKSGIHLRAA